MQAQRGRNGEREEKRDGDGVIKIKRLRVTPYEQCVLMIIIRMIIITAIHLFTCTNAHIQTVLLPLASLTECINTHI